MLNPMTEDNFGLVVWSWVLCNCALQPYIVHFGRVVRVNILLISWVILTF